MYFSSKKDLWMGLLYGFSTFIMIILPLILGDFSIILFFALVLPGTLIVVMWFRTGYKILNETLIIVYGVFNIRVNIMDIKKLEYMTSPFVGPALSVKRIGITYNNYKFVTVSPKNKKDFVNELLKANPNIKVGK